MAEWYPIGWAIFGVACLLGWLLVRRNHQSLSHYLWYGAYFGLISAAVGGLLHLSFGVALAILAGVLLVASVARRRAGG